MHVLVFCLLFRLINALAVRTTFAPDEYWQSLEVAHRMVFGYGHLTWEWAAGLRGYLHTTIFAAFYWVLKTLGLDSGWAVAKGPMLVQAAFAAATDLVVYRTARLLFGQRAARWALACQLLSWFNFYCSVRTYSNCLEGLLTSAAAYHLLASGAAQPAQKRGLGSSPAAKAAAAAAVRTHQQVWLLLAALAVVVRPACALFWGALGAYLLATTPGATQRRQLAADAVTIGGCCLYVATIFDRLHYGRWVLVPWEFARFNLLGGGSALYGAHPWHWNLSQGFPAVAATLLPLMALGVALALDRRLAALAALSLAAYSLPAHKEFRFLLPALQLVMPYCGVAVAWLLSGRGGSAAAPVGPKGKGTRGGTDDKSRQGVKAALVAAALLAAAAVQVAMALYFSLVQHRGLLEVMDEIGAEWRRSPATTSVLFLTPCHATPWYSHLHAPLPMRFLDCSPPGWAGAVRALNAGEEAWLRLPKPPKCAGGRSQPAASCLSQQALFRRDPGAFVQRVLAENLQPPRLVVAYEEQLGDGGLAAALRQHGYSSLRRITNCWWQTDDDTPCTLVLLHRAPPAGAAQV